MTEPELQSQIDAATSYEEFFLPALFNQWPSHVLDAARVGPGQKLLDVACGTGILARAALARVSPGGSVSGLDLNPGMLAVATKLEPGIAWRQGMAESLPYPDASFDVVVSQFGLMFFTDRLKAVSEMRRVLTQGGRLAVAVWDSLDHIPGYAAEVALVERISGEHAANPLRAPFLFGDTDELAALFKSAGVSDVSVMTHHGVARFPSIRSMLDADIKGWLPLMGVTLSIEEIDQIFDEAEQELSSFVAPDGSVAFDLPAHITSGSKG
jgi:SAM-dependent methyltransferase